MSARTSVGVCYYPEQWPESIWAHDARRMVEAGITHVRIGEFAWSRMEPEPGRYDWDWLDRAIETLAGRGLKLVLGTPTAAPPKWLVDSMPDMLQVGADGLVRGFGSRRHYCFSHDGYIAECARIVTAMAERYGRHPALVAWQIDNEYGCHDTTLSYSKAARNGFRRWLAGRYASIEALNEAWGNVFWSMTCRSFDEIELPAMTPAQANPAHLMDFRRYSSERVALFNRHQVEILRRLSPGRTVLHNYMGRMLAFDHFACGADLDAAAWDSYPLGHLDERVGADEERRRRFARQGDPDYQAFHHDLYRSVGRGRFWIMEQQPGPVNWAPHNPAPLPGMVRAWGWDAAAHGAEVVSYFRWRQVPYAQEQMHAGLLRPDDAPAPALAEVAQLARELAAIELGEPRRAPVAIVFDYPSAWAWEIEPQGRGFSYFDIVFEAYRALRRRGLAADIVPASTESFAGYRLVLIPALFAWTGALRRAVAGHDGLVLIGPRSGAKTPDFRIPDALPPDLGPDILDLKVSRVETLRPDADVPLEGGGAFRLWRETVEPGRAKVLWRTHQGEAALLAQDTRRYLAGMPDTALWDRLIGELAGQAGLPLLTLPDGLRLHARGELLIAINYMPEPVDLRDIGLAGPFGLDGPVLPPAGVAIMPAAAQAAWPVSG